MLQSFLRFCSGAAVLVDGNSLIDGDGSTGEQEGRLGPFGQILHGDGGRLLLSDGFHYVEIVAPGELLSCGFQTVSSIYSYYDRPQATPRRRFRLTASFGFPVAAFNFAQKRPRRFS